MDVEQSWPRLYGNLFTYKYAIGVYITIDVVCSMCFQGQVYSIHNVALCGKFCQCLEADIVSK
jgi:hypothetical protein